MTQQLNFQDFIAQQAKALGLNLGVTSDMSGEQLNTEYVFIVNDDLLVLVPVFSQSEQVCNVINMITDNFNVYPKWKRKWRDSPMLRAQCLAILSVVKDKPKAHELFLYSNGVFTKKYFSNIAKDEPKVFAMPGYRLGNLSANEIENLFGQHAVENLNYSFSPDQSSYFCYNNRLNLLGVGRGKDMSTMRRGAIYEYIERASAHYDKDDSIQTSHALGQYPTVNPAQLWGVEPDREAQFFPSYDDDKPYSWVSGRNALTDEAVYIPSAMVNYLKVMPEQFLHNPNSSGCAIGNSADESAFYSALEIIERDALMVTWYTKSAPSRIDLSNCREKSVLEHLKWIDIKGYDVECYDITTDIGIPSVLCLMLGRSEHNIAALVTSSAHTNPLEALDSALAEGASLIGICELNFFRKAIDYETFKAGTDFQATENQYMTYCYPQELHKFDFMRNTGNTVDVDTFCEQYAADVSSMDTAYAYLKTQLVDNGYDLYVAESTPSYIQNQGLYFTRAFIPGAINLIFGDHPIHVNSQRVDKAASKLAWINDASHLQFEDLQPLG